MKVEIMAKTYAIIIEDNDRIKLSQGFPISAFILVIHTESYDIKFLNRMKISLMSYVFKVFLNINTIFLVPVM